MADLYAAVDRERERRKGGERASDGRRAAKCTVTAKFGVVLPTPGVT